MLSTLGKKFMLGRLITPLRYQFGGGHHHEIDYQAVVTKNKKSGKIQLIQVTTWTQMKLPEESPELWPITITAKMLRKWPSTLSGGS